MSLLLHISHVFLLLNGAEPVDTSILKGWEKFHQSEDGSVYFFAPNSKSKPRRKARISRYAQVWTKKVYASPSEIGVYSANAKWHIACSDKKFMLGSIILKDKNNKKIGSRHETGYYKLKNYEPIQKPSIIAKVADIACKE